MTGKTNLTHQNFAIPLEWYLADGDNNQSGNRSGLLLLHDQWGLDDFTRAAAARLADAGYMVVLPDLFARHGAPADDSDAARQDFLYNLSDTQVIGDAMAALGFLAQHESVDKRCLGVLGWGWGGGFALMVGGYDQRVHAIIDIGGVITYPMLSPNHPGSPLNFIADIEGAVFAAYAEKDAQPAGEIARLRDQLIDHDKFAEVSVFTGTTGRFWREDTPQAALLWQHIQQFLTQVFNLNTETQIFADGGRANESSRLHA